MSLFKLRGSLSKSQSLTLGLVGLVIFLLFWWLMAEVFSRKVPIVEDYNTELPSMVGQDSARIAMIRDSILLADSIKVANATVFKKIYPVLPTPLSVLLSYPEMTAVGETVTLNSGETKTLSFGSYIGLLLSSSKQKKNLLKDDLIFNAMRSIWLNIKGYFWAIFIAIPIGFLIGLLPIFRGLFSKQVDALRYLPLTALTGLFIVWFGIEDQMKIAFLAFGILVYLLPVVVQRIDEVKDVYLKTVFTLGASDWQTIKSVYMPSVLSKLIDDIRVLTAISWTYIIIAELINRQGGIGSMIYIKARQGEIEKVFAILIVIILIGFMQDRIFVYLDKRLFSHKYYKTSITGIKEVVYGIFAILGCIALVAIIQPIINGLIPALSLSLGTVVSILIIASFIIILYGEFRLRQSTAEK